MLTYITRRLLQMVVTLFVISVVSFLIVYTAPGEPFTDGLDPNNEPAVTEYKIEQHGLDDPLHQQYLRFYGNFFGDCWVLCRDGLDSSAYSLYSFKSNEPVLPTLIRRMFVTLPLVLVGILIAWTLSFPIGIFSALRRGSVVDRSITIAAYALIAFPSFWLGLLVIRFFTQTADIPVIGPQTASIELEGFQAFMDKVWHVGIPAILSSFAVIAVLTRYVKGQMLEVLDSDYVRTARAKGLGPTAVNYKHALRNAALPFITMIAFILPSLFGGSVVFESIYSWPGLGRWVYNAVLQRDYAIVIVDLFVVSGLTLVGILISDLLYGVVDPRIRLA